jgi:hypothetical protein
MNNETVLPPKNGHSKEHHANGSVERMAPPLKADDSLEGLKQASIKMMEETYNGEADINQSKVALGHATNAVAIIKQQISAVRGIDKTKNPAIVRTLAAMVGGQLGKQLALEPPKPEAPAADEPKEEGRH